MADNKGDQGRSASMKVDTGLVRELADLLNETGLTEIEVEDGDRKIRVSRTLMAVAQPQAPALAHAAQQSAASPDAGAPMVDQGAEAVDAIRSPMVGTAYLSADPGSDPFIKKGDAVKAGDTLLIVEAMKVMNPITAPSDGIVKDILVENAQPVEFDQPLIVLS